MSDAVRVSIPQFVDGRFSQIVYVGDSAVEVLRDRPLLGSSEFETVRPGSVMTFDAASDTYVIVGPLADRIREIVCEESSV